MTDQSERPSWAGPASDLETAAAERRRRIRGWVRWQSLLVVGVVVMLDIVVVLATSAIQNIRRNNAGRPCATFWADLAHTTTVDIWTVAVILVVIALLFVWRRWLFVAALVVQLVAAAILLPPQFHARSQFTAVAEGRQSPVNVDSGGAACDG